MTKNKKQYAGMIALQEGVLFVKPKFDIKGLAIKKVQTPKIARKRFGQILEKEMLVCSEINPTGVFRTFLDFEREITDSLRSGETKFLKPARYTKESAYKAPLTQQAVRGVRLWNALYPSMAIPEFTNVNLLKLRNIEFEGWQEIVPKELHDCFETYFSDEEIWKYGASILAVPKNVEKVPEDILPFVNYVSIVNDNMKNGNILLESLGFKIIKSSEQSAVSNIVEI